MLRHSQRRKLKCACLKSCPQVKGHGTFSQSGPDKEPLLSSYLKLGWMERQGISGGREITLAAGVEKVMQSESSFPSLILWLPVKKKNSNHFKIKSPETWLWRLDLMRTSYWSRCVFLGDNHRAWQHTPPPNYCSLTNTGSILKRTQNISLGIGNSRGIIHKQYHSKIKAFFPPDNQKLDKSRPMLYFSGYLPEHNRNLFSLCLLHLAWFWGLPMINL